MRTTGARYPQMAVVRQRRVVVRRTVVAVVRGYRVYDARTIAYLGGFSARAKAWEAADEHLISEMLRRGSWVTGEYFVIVVGDSVAVEVESQMTHLGPPDEVDECRRWLGSLPGRA